MGLFSKKELAALQIELDRAKADHEKAAKALAENGRKVEKIQSRFDQVVGDKTELEKKVGILQMERDRAKEEQAKAEQMGRWLEERLKKAETELAAAKAHPEPVVVSHDAGIEDEVDGLKAESAGLKAAIEALKSASARIEREARMVARKADQPESASELAALRDELQSFRRRLAESEERRRLAIRKAEHNRRAYLVTQLQLDMAEDRVYFMTHGKPRPVLATGPDGEPLRGHVRIEAEDVPEAEEAAPDDSIQVETPVTDAGLTDSSQAEAPAEDVGLPDPHRAEEGLA